MKKECYWRVLGQKEWHHSYVSVVWTSDKKRWEGDPTPDRTLLKFVPIAFQEETGPADRVRPFYHMDYDVEIIYVT